MKTFDQIRSELSEGSPFAEIVLMYYALREGVITPTTGVEKEHVETLMFGALLGKQELGELPGALNPKNR